MANLVLPSSQIHAAFWLTVREQENQKPADSVVTSYLIAEWTPLTMVSS